MKMKMTRPAAPNAIAAGEHELAAARLRDVMGFCTACAADFLGGHEHTPDCELRAATGYEVRPAVVAPKRELQAVRLDAREKWRAKLAHLRTAGERVTLCGEDLVVGGNVILPKDAKITCRRCRKEGGLPALAKKPARARKKP